MIIGAYQLKGSAIKVGVNLRIESDDLSGQGSDTTRAQKGIKAKVINVSLMITHANKQDLTDLVLLAESLDESGNQTIYQIVDPSSNAMNIKQATFNDNFNVKEMRDKKAWNIVFSMIEHRSSSEKNEQRIEGVSPATQGDTASKTITATGANTQATQALTPFEEILKKVDNYLK